MKNLLLVAILATMSAFAFDSDNCRTCDGETVVPEPATIGLMGAGIAAIGFAAWRKNRKR